MPSINRRGNSRTPACCPKFPNTSCCASLDTAGTSKFFTDFRSLNGFTVMQFFSGGTAVGGPNGLVITTNLPGPAEVDVVGDLPLLNPSTDEFCICFDVNPLLSDSTHGVLAGLFNVGALQQIELVSNPAGNWLFVVIGPSGFAVFPTGISVVTGSFTRIKICRLAGDPSNTFTVTIGDNAPQQFVVAAGAVPNVPLSIIYAVVASPGASIQIARSTSFCADFRSVPALMAPSTPPIATAPPSALDASPFERVRQILGFPSV